MMKTILTILFALSLMNFNKPDLGAPAIQAICKVTLKSGEVIEGIISYGKGGYVGSYKPNGFYFEYENGNKSLQLYDLSFNGFRLSSEERKNTQIYYVENISELWSKKVDIEFDEKEKIIRKTMIDVNEYQLLPEMTLYSKIPLDMVVGYSENGEDGKFSIAINEIIAVQLLRKPSQEWLHYIDAARQRMALASKEEEWVDFQEPVWYHEIITDHAILSYLEPYFSKDY